MDITALDRKAGHSKSAFVVMPFLEEYSSMYQSVFVPALEGAGYSVSRGDECLSILQITHDIERAIVDASIILCFLDSRNPNVYYELGLAHALGKPTILIAAENEKIPFDISHIRIVLYNSEEELWEKKLIEDISAIAKKIDFNNLSSHLCIIPHMIYRNVSSQIKEVFCLFKAIVTIFSTYGAKFRLHYLDYDADADNLCMAIQDKIYPDHNFEILVGDGLKQNIVICEAVFTKKIIHKTLPAEHATIYEENSTIPETLSSVMASPIINNRGQIIGVVALDSKVKFDELGIEIDDLVELFLELCSIVKSILNLEV